MKSKKDPNIDQKGDFILRWKLSPQKRKRSSKDPFRDFVRDLLRELLDLAVLTSKGEDIKIDGFHFLNSMDIHRIFKRKR